MALASCSWLNHSINGELPSPRQGHALAVQGEVLYVFGGSSTSQDGSDILYYGDLYAFMVRQNSIECKRLQQCGHIPSRREGHCLCVHEQSLYLYGGKNTPDATSCLPYLYRMDLRTNKWVRVETSGVAPRSLGFSMSEIAGVLYVFGGLQDREAVNDVYMLQTDSLTWAPLKVAGELPMPRCDHGAAVVKDEIFIFGGYGSEDQAFNDVYVLNTRTLLWTEVKTQGTPPPARGGHTFTAHRDKDIYVFGGTNDSMQDGQGLFGDLHKLSLAKCKWKRPLYTGVGPQKRYGHVAAIVHSTMYILGGMDENGEVMDIHVLKLINPSERQPVLKDFMEDSDFECQTTGFSPTRVPKLQYQLENPPFSQPALSTPPEQEQMQSIKTLNVERNRAIQFIQQAFDLLEQQYAELDREHRDLEVARLQIEQQQLENKLLYHKQQQELQGMLAQHKEVTEKWLAARRQENDRERQQLANEREKIKVQRQQLQKELESLYNKGKQLHNVAQQFREM